MKLENGYKVIYEVAADGKRAFYASKSISYPNRDEEGNIVDFKMAEFEDKNYKGKVIYEYKGKFYVSVKSLPSYDENGIPTDYETVNFKVIERNCVAAMWKYCWVRSALQGALFYCAPFQTEKETNLWNPH